MNAESSAFVEDSSDEIIALARQIHEAQERLRELTGGEVDAVIHPDGHSYLLHEAQEKLRQSETAQRQLAETQMAILNALPAHIALVDLHGVIISTNDVWRRLVSANALQGPEFGVGQNYVEVCEQASGNCSEEAHAAAAGIRSVLRGEARDFTLEYPCHSPTEQRWFRLVVTPMREDRPAGAVVMHVNVTDRKLAEEALASSEGNMAAGQRIAHIGSWEIKLTNLIDVYANRPRWSDEMFRIMGYEPGAVEVSTDLFIRQVPAEEREAIRREVAAAIAERRQYHVVHRLLRPNGEERLVEEMAQIIYDEKTGQPLKMIGTAHDITEQRRTEDALRENETKFRTLFDVAKDAIFMLHDGVFVDCNAMGPELFGATRDQVIGHSPIQFSPPTQPDGRASEEKAREIIQRALEGEPQFFEWMHQRMDGTEVPVEVSLCRFELRGEPFIQCIVRNIAERKRTEARFRRLVDSNAQGVFFWNTKGEITGANDAFLQLIGYHRKELEAGAINWMEVTAQEYAHLDRRALEELASTGTCATYEKELCRKDGTRVPVLLGAAMFEDNRDEGVCFMLDLTERKKLEQQFLRAQRMESIGTLAGGIAHDLNNILAPIMMSIDILKTVSDHPQAKAILDTIEVSAKRGADIVRQVLSFARGIESERIEVHPKHLLKDLENIIKETFPKDIQMQFSVPEETWKILGDPTQVHQVLLNLCVNARDAMPHGGKLTIGAENCVLDEHYAVMNTQAKAGRYVRISVTDSGTGMPPGIIDKIFEPFFTTKELNKGTGLGLSTVMAVVKSHDGVVNVYSEPGRGTTFKVYLPAMESSTEVGERQTTQLSLERGKGETILVIDDEASILTITSQTLQAFGYRVLTATDGADALAIYAEHKSEIAAVLTDMMMPVMEGMAVIHVLTRINPSVKIIAASGLSANSDVTAASSGTVKHFLTKPYTAGTLLRAIRAILDEPKS